jgi:hypothetical protein
VESWAITNFHAAQRYGPVLENSSQIISKAGRRGGKLKSTPRFSCFCTGPSQRRVERPPLLVESAVRGANDAGEKFTGFPQATAYPKFPRRSLRARKTQDTKQQKRCMTCGFSILRKGKNIFPGGR